MMTTRKYRLIAIPAEQGQELDEILHRAGYKTGRGYGSQRGAAVMELLRRVDTRIAHPIIYKTEAEYWQAMADSDADITKQLEGDK